VESLRWLATAILWICFLPERCWRAEVEIARVRQTEIKERSCMLAVMEKEPENTSVEMKEQL
jgi:hypothetical protein